MNPSAHASGPSIFSALARLSSLGGLGLGSLINGGESIVADGPNFDGNSLFVNANVAGYQVQTASSASAEFTYDWLVTQGAIPFLPPAGGKRRCNEQATRNKGLVLARQPAFARLPSGFGPRLALIQAEC